MTIALAARITSVTVHADSARVVRVGTRALPTGPSVVVLSGLSGFVRPDSVRVAVFGAGVRVGDVDVVARYETRTLPPDLVVDLDRLRDEDEALGDALDVVARRLAALATLEDTGSRVAARALVTGRAGAEAVDGLLAASAERVAAAHAERRRLAAERRRVQERRQALEAERDIRSKQGPLLQHEVRVGVDAAEAVEARFEVTAVVNGAQWEPVYDARLDGDQVHLTAHAVVRQSTGDDWNGVELTVSTARPGRSVVVPELGPWLVDEARPFVPGPQRRMARMSAAGPPPPGAPAAAAAAMAPADVDIASPEQVGAAATFRVARPADVPSDGSPHKVVIAAVDLDAELDYVTVPKIAQEAYLRATVTNTSGVTLLAGPVSVYHDEQFVGSTRLDTLPDGAEAELQLGVDDRVEVERKLVGRHTGRALLGPGRTNVGYRTTVANHLPTPVKVAVIDNVPIAGRDDLKVKVDTLDPQPTERDDLGVCVWRLSIDPGRSAVITLAATVEHPRGMRLSGI